MTDRADRITALLEDAFAPTTFDLVDESERHAGHAGAGEAGESHYRLVMVSAAFRGLSRLDRSRAVHTLLEPEFQSGLHAIALTLRTPEEQTGGATPPL